MRVVVAAAGSAPLVRDPVGIRLWQVASLEHRTLCLHEVARPHMSNLNDRKGCLVQLAVLGGHDIVIVEQVRSRGQPAYPDRIGDRVQGTDNSE